MKFIKRIIALSLAALMTMCGVYAAKSEISGLSNEYADRTALVSYLEIADRVSETEAKETQVLRGNFAVSVAKMINLSVSSEQSKRYFIDVPNDHWAVSEINALVDLGIISVSDDKYFRPADPITDTEALKMVMTAAGYGDLAIANGGYPYGYTKAARTLKMSDFSTGEQLNFAKAVDLIYEGLTIPLYDMTTFGETVKYEQSTENILSQYFDMYTKEGTVTYADGIAVDGGGNEDDGYVRIDGETFKSDIVFLPYIGQIKSFVYKQENFGDDKEIVLLNSINKNEKILVIDRDSFREYSESENRVMYYDDNKSRSANIAASAKALKNGKMLRNNTKEAFDFNKGSITLIDSDENGEYDYILTFEYKNYVADRIEKLNKVVYDKAAYANSINLDESKGDRKIIIEKGGVRVDFDAIAENDVLTVYESDVFVRVIITSGQITGNLYKISTDENSGAPKLNIGKVESDATDYVMDKDYFNDVIGDTASLPIGTSATYFTDAFGKIVYIQYETGLPWQYAYVMNYSTENTFDTVVKLKLLIQSGTIGVYEISDKIKIDGASIKDSNKILSLLDKSRYVSKGTLGEGEDSIKGQLIRVKINSEDKISEIDTEYSDVSAEGTQNLKRTAPAQSLYYRYHPQSFDGKIIKNSNTVCFLVPNQKNIPSSADKEFRVIPASSSYFWDKTHLVEGFKLNQDNGAEDAIVIYADSSADSYDNKFFIVESVSETMTTDGVLTKTIHLWSNGVEYDYTCDEDYDLSVEVNENGQTAKYYVQEGDIVKLALNFNNYVTGAKIFYDYSRRNDVDYSISTGAMESNYYTDRGNIFYTYVKKISNGIIGMRFSKPDKNEYLYEPEKIDYITSMSGSAVMIFDSNVRGGKISMGTLSDIIPSNKAGDDTKPYFLITSKGIVTGAILYR